MYIVPVKIVLMSISYSNRGYMQSAHYKTTLPLDIDVNKVISILESEVVPLFTVIKIDKFNWSTQHCSYLDSVTCDINNDCYCFSIGKPQKCLNDTTFNVDFDKYFKETENG